MPADPVGGREAEIEAALREILRLADEGVSWLGISQAARHALDVLRSSGSAAQNQEEPGLRKTLYDVGAWLSSGNFAGWEMVVQEIEATLARSSGSAAQNQEERRILSAVRAAMDGPRPIPDTVKDGIVRMIDSAPPRSSGSAAQNQEEPDERALDTPLGARQRAQTQRDVADILEFGSPQDEDHETSARSPQDKDHEAGINREALMGWLSQRLSQPACATAYLADDLIAYLSRCSSPLSWDPVGIHDPRVRASRSPQDEDHEEKT